MASFVHPLDPLSIEEVELAATFVKDEVLPVKNLALKPAFGKVAAAPESMNLVRLISISAVEPPKEVVVSYQRGDPWDREAEVIFSYVKREAGRVVDSGAVECVVALGNRGDEFPQRLVSWMELPREQPSLCMDEFFLVEELVKNDAAFQAAMAKRGLDDASMWMVEPWSCGYGGPAEAVGNGAGRIVRALTWVRLGDACDNGYAHPVDGLVAVVDLTTEQVRVEEHGAPPVPQAPGNYSDRLRGGAPPREDLRPLEITQPEGASFILEGNLLRWGHLTFRIGWNLREGVHLHCIQYDDKDTTMGEARGLRDIIYRLSIAEMVVPYGSNDPIHSRKNAFDLGEYGVGMLTNSLVNGCDCLGEIHYLDAYTHDCEGHASVLKNAICIHEEDAGLLVKHTDWRTEQVDLRRGRRLVVSSCCTVGNYEYLFNYHFYMDGRIDVAIRHTGLVNTSASGGSRYSTSLSTDGLEAQIHQHMYCLRVDWNVDGPLNRLVEVNSRAEDDDRNPYGSAFLAEETTLHSEVEARRNVSMESARFWKIVSSTEKNHVGQPTAWAIVPQGNCFPYSKPDSWIQRRASFLRYHLFCSPYDRDERWPAGKYPNQSSGEEDHGVMMYTSKDRNIVNQDLVTWYTFGMHHVVRLEDWPIMPMADLRVLLKPCGFFDRNPALDVPPPSPACKKCDE